MCFWSFSENEWLFQFCKCCHTRSYKLRAAVLRPHHTHITDTRTSHTTYCPPAARDTGAHSSQPTRFSLIQGQKFTSHKFTSLFKNISKSYSMISSRCLIQNSVLQLPLFIYVLNASHSYNYLVCKFFILYGEIFHKRRTFVSNNVLFHAPSSGHRV